MSILRFSDGQNFFEMGVAIEEDRSLQNYGDAYVTVKAQSEGFNGHNDLWVLGTALAAFCHSLVQLNRSLKGEAALESISPRELELKVRSVTSRGNLAVEGSTGYHIQGRNGQSYWHAVSFGLEFEPSQLSAAIELPWVQKYAG
jgi:hypothetical protein